MAKITSIIKRACDDLNIENEFLNNEKLFLIVNFGNYKHFFFSRISGLNNESVSRVFDDKLYTYLLLKDVINLPKTSSYIDADAPEPYSEYGTFDSNNNIIDSILDGHTLPVILKPNKGFAGHNVFLCKNKRDIKRAIRNIYNKKSRHYDHVLLTQDTLDIKEEYRVVVYNNELIFMYKKDIEEAKFDGNISPLHWENAKTVLIKDESLIDEIKEFIKQISSKVDVQYAGLDVVRDDMGKLWLLEINSKPGFTKYLEHNSDEEIYKLYVRILTDLKKKFISQN